MRRIPDGYETKLNASGKRAIYPVRDGQLLLLVLAIGKREREEAYEDAIRNRGKSGDE